MCGHDNPAGASFCLNCGTATSGYAQTPLQAAGLPGTCSACGTANPPGMKFCRNCGTVLASSGAPLSSGPGSSPGMYGGAPPPRAASQPGIGLGGFDARAQAGVAATVAAPTPAPGNYGSGPGAQVQCPRCGASTPASFAYCQQCGLHLQAVAPTDPSGPSGAMRAGAAQAVARQSPSLPGMAAGIGPGIDPQGATLAAPYDGQRAAAPSAAAWGTAVLVNRDGSDGERFALTNDYVEIGRAGAGIAFAEDRFLAHSHARLERTAQGAQVIGLDALNGVFRKLDAPVELVDGAVVLVGREVLRFERVDRDERDAEPLVQHGVALFGSPPRAPWGRMRELLPSGGVRDIRHLHGEEVVIGREEGDLVYRDDAFMSRRHAVLSWDGQTARLTDLGSSNGTFLRLRGATALRHCDHLRMGDQLFRIELG
jgi:pSer/pThr/pTyr-binding forkhead associated (FHA) protein